MEKIRLTRAMEITSILSKTKSSGSTNIKFKANSETGYVPLLKLFSLMTHGSEDFFSAKRDLSISRTMSSVIGFDYLYKILKFRRVMRSRRIENNDPSTIVISMLSVLGISGEQERLFSRMVYRSDRSEQSVFVSSSIDVFALAVIETKNIGKINVQDRFIEMPRNIVKILVSEKKLMDVNFMSNFYNKTVRKHLIDRMKELEIPIETVSDEELAKYYTRPYSIKTNSLSEIMQHDRTIKEKVLTNIKESLVI